MCKGKVRVKVNILLFTCCDNDNFVDLLLISSLGCLGKLNAGLTGIGIPVGFITSRSSETSGLLILMSSPPNVTLLGVFGISTSSSSSYEDTEESWPDEDDILYTSHKTSKSLEENNSSLKVMRFLNYI